jgi:hypothetical protein
MQERPRERGQGWGAMLKKTLFVEDSDDEQMDAQSGWNDHQSRCRSQNSWCSPQTRAWNGAAQRRDPPQRERDHWDSRDTKDSRDYDYDYGSGHGHDSGHGYSGNSWGSSQKDYWEKW